MAVFKNPVLLNISDEEDSRTERVNRDIKAASTPAVRDVCVCMDSLSGQETHCCRSLRRAPETHKHTKLNPTMHSAATGLMICHQSLNCLELKTSKISTAARSFRFLIHCTIIIRNTVLLVCLFFGHCIIIRNLTS